MKILISGGGIGGLTAALCLARQGHDITVLEQAPAFSEVGAGLQISPNGMRVLQSLGLEAVLRQKGFEPERIEMRFGQSGKTIFSIPLKDEAQRRWGAPYLHLHRADLLGVLEQAAREAANISILTGAKVESYQQSTSGVEVILEGGQTLDADLLIGADGIHSKVRETILGPEAPRFTGCVAWRGVVDLSKLKTPPPPTACVWVGKGRHAVTYRLRGGTLANFVGVVETDDWKDESWTSQGSQAEVMKDFSGWHPVISELIGAGHDWFKWALFDRAPLPKWSEGRVTLLGDAAHPTLPFLAQGAVMAIEDAAVLANCLTGAKSPEAALKRYEALRLPRTGKLQAAARQNKATFHHSDPASRLAVYGPMWLGARLLPNVVHSRMDWVYGYDALVEG